MEAPLFFWSQAKSAEQLISKTIFPTQYSDVTALTKNERASPQHAKLKNFLRVKLYLKSETNFFSLLVFTGSQGSENWRRARHDDATFVMKTKSYKKEVDTLFSFFLLGWWPFKWRKQPLIFLFGFLLEPGQRPLQGKSKFETSATSRETKAHAIRSSAEKRKTSKWKIQDFNQGGWPQIMPSSAKPGQAQPEALRFSQFKKEKLLGVLATYTNYREAFTNLLGGSGLSKRKLPKSGIQFFRLLVFTESQVLPGTFNSRKKNSKIP